MTQTTFTDNVVIEGSQDIEQLRVQGHTTQEDPLQTWENNAGDVLAEVTGDGRIVVGDTDGSPDSLIEAHQLDDSLTKPNRGFHSLGQVSGTLSTLIQWIVGELELTGSDDIDALHTALRIRASNLNTGTPTSSAELRGADIEIINDADASDDPLTKVTGLQIRVTNETDKVITDAIGLKIKLTNDGTITNPFSIYTEGEGPVHLEDYIEVKLPAATPGTPDTDFIRIYPKSNGKIYAKNWAGAETELGGGNSGNSITVGNFADTRPSIPVSGDLFIPEDGYFHEYYDGSAWVPTRDGIKHKYPTDYTWTWVNQGSAVVANDKGTIAITPDTAAAYEIRTRKKAAPTAPYKITACWAVAPYIGNTGWGIGWRENSSDKYAVIFADTNTTYAIRWTSSAGGFLTYTSLPIIPKWMQIEDDGTNRICRISNDGINWQQLHSVSNTDYITADEVCFFVTDYSGTQVQSRLLSWKEE